MNFPSDESMMMLTGLALGDDVFVRDGRLHLFIRGEHIDSPIEWPISDAALNELDSRGWINCDTTPPAITQNGRYWLDRWAKRSMGKGRIVRIHRMKIESTN